MPRCRRSPSAAACDDALRLAGDLLPDDLAEWWLDEPRERLRLRVEQLLGAAAGRICFA